MDKFYSLVPLRFFVYCALNKMQPGKALILGTHSFVDGGTKVGSQYVAEGLAKAGWQVDYLATASSPLDIWGSQRHARLKRAWFGENHHSGVAIAPGLTEFSFRSIFPAHRLFLRFSWQLETFGWLLPNWFRETKYDICISDVAVNMVYLPWVRTKHCILRLNDWPAGFAHDLHKMLIRFMEQGLRNATFREIWAVSRPLADYASSLNPRNVVVHIPNGVDIAINDKVKQPRRIPRSAIYIGGFTAWLDLSLLEKVAALLPQWSFHVYGPGRYAVHSATPNLHFHTAVARVDVPAILATFEVGLIPFCDSQGRMTYVHRPLKFYEYIAAGLGVASTEVGGLKAGMGPLACYGSTPLAFANAVVMAGQQAQARPSQFAKDFIREHEWPAVMRDVTKRLQNL